MGSLGADGQATWERGMEDPHTWVPLHPWVLFVWIPGILCAINSVSLQWDHKSCALITHKGHSDVGSHTGVPPPNCSDALVSQSLCPPPLHHPTTRDLLACNLTRWFQPTQLVLLIWNTQLVCPDNTPKHNGEHIRQPLCFFT